MRANAHNLFIYPNAAYARAFGPLSYTCMHMCGRMCRRICTCLCVLAGSCVGAYVQAGVCVYVRLCVCGCVCAGALVHARVRTLCLAHVKGLKAPWVLDLLLKRGPVPLLPMPEASLGGLPGFLFFAAAAASLSACATLAPATRSACTLAASPCLAHLLSDY